MNETPMTLDKSRPFDEVPPPKLPWWMEGAKYLQDGFLFREDGTRIERPADAAE